MFSGSFELIEEPPPVCENAILHGRFIIPYRGSGNCCTNVFRTVYRTLSIMFLSQLLHYLKEGAVLWQ